MCDAVDGQFFFSYLFCSLSAVYSKYGVKLNILYILQMEYTKQQIPTFDNIDWNM